MIHRLRTQVRNYRRDSIPLAGITKEILIHYPDIERVSYAPSVEMNASGPDTIPTFLIGWKNGSSHGTRKKNRAVLKAWLKQRLELDTVRIIEF